MQTEPRRELRTVDVRTADERALDEAADLRERIARERATAQALAEYLEVARARVE